MDVLHHLENPEPTPEYDREGNKRPPATPLFPARFYNHCAYISQFVCNPSKSSDRLKDALFIVVNKMDLIPEDKREECFSKISTFLKQSMKGSSIPIVPASALEGNHLVCFENN
jgi:hypothetical protein